MLSLATWMDWCFYAYKKELIAIVFFSVVWYFFRANDFSFEGAALGAVIGLCAWVVWCAVVNGYGIG